MVLLKLVTNYDDSMFMVHVKLSCVRHNVLMRHKKNVGIYQTQSWVVCRGSVELWVTWVMGHEYDPLLALWRSRWSCGAFDSNSGHRIYPVFLVLQNISFDKTQTRLIDKRL